MDLQQLKKELEIKAGTFSRYRLIIYNYHLFDAMTITEFCKAVRVDSSLLRAMTDAGLFEKVKGKYFALNTDRTRRLKCTFADRIINDAKTLKSEQNRKASEKRRKRLKEKPEPVTQKIKENVNTSKQMALLPFFHVKDEGTKQTNTNGRICDEIIFMINKNYDSLKMNAEFTNIAINHLKQLTRDPEGNEIKYSISLTKTKNI